MRPWTPDEDVLVLRALERAFLSDPDPALSAVERATLEHARTLSAWEGPTPVATAGAFSFRMAVPGAVLPVAGVTWVSVQTTHRRQGLLTRMMTTQLEQLHASGEAVAALWASEPGIYGRYGYGGASRSLSVQLRRGDVLRPGLADAALGVREVELEQARPALAAVWDASYPSRPGQYARTPAWWDHVLVDPERDRGGHAALRCMLLDDARGYAVFSTRSSWDDRGPAGEVKVRELVAVDGPARLRLVEHLLGIDLVSTWSLRGLSLDDALLGAVVDSRRLAPQLHDALHVRLVRVGEALAGRTYTAELDVVLDVDDARLPDNARRWRLSAGPRGATCAPTDAPPDLALGVEDLGAAYLGGTTLVSLAASGRVRELRAGALVAASRAFRGDVEPLCTHVF